MDERDEIEVMPMPTHKPLPGTVYESTLSALNAREALARMKEMEKTRHRDKQTVRISATTVACGSDHFIKALKEQYR